MRNDKEKIVETKLKKMGKCKAASSAQECLSVEIVRVIIVEIVSRSTTAASAWIRWSTLTRKS